MKKYLLEVLLVVGAEESEAAILDVRRALDAVSDAASVRAVTDEGGERTVIEPPIPWPPTERGERQS